MSKRTTLFIFLLVLVMLVAACSREEEEPPTLAATAEPVEVPTDTPVPEEPEDTPTPEEPEPVGDPWERIQESGTIRVGTAADYPPFEYYTPDFEFDGLDMAIIRDIGDRLDLDVEIIDFAFEGLGDALNLGQIDVAIAGISVTGERMGEFEFSNIYFASEDAILGHEDAAVEITSVADLADYRVGVQAGTVYQDWLEETLVDEGLMAPENLAVYVGTSEMVADLETGFVDLLVADKQPLELALEAGPFTIAGGGFQPQLFAIGMPKGASELQAQINRALDEMVEDGTLFDLVGEYLDIELEEILPPDFVLPEPIPPSPEDCVDGMAFVADINLDDENMSSPPSVPPGQAFEKGWELQNTGTCNWNPNYQLVYVGGNVPAARMGGEPTPVQGLVGPGENYDILVDLIAPLKPGVYQGFWQMENADGQAFGQRIWVGITVRSIATVTPIPTVPPPANVSFSADPATISEGECSTLTWSASGAKEVYVYAVGQPWPQFQVPETGQRVVCPATTTGYELRVVNFDGTVVIQRVTVTVVPVVGAPIITRFTVEPTQVPVGACLNLQWIVEGVVGTVKVFRDTTVIRDPAPTSAAMVDCPPAAGQYTYTLEAAGPGGVSRQVRYAQVIQGAPTPTPTPVPTGPPPPQVNYFSAQPDAIEVNNCTTLSWSTSGGTTYVQIKRDEAVIYDNAPFQGSARDCPSQANVYTYRAVAFNAAGEQRSVAQQVAVVDDQPDNPLVGTNWSLISINGVATIPGTSITASFGNAGTVNGSGGCNSYSAGYSAGSDNIRVSNLSSSQQLCSDPSGIMEQESTYFAALPQSISYVLGGGQLTINTTGGQTLIFSQR